MENNTNLLIATERYLNGEMNAEEIAQFNALKNSSPEMNLEIDNLVHFYRDLKVFSEITKYKSLLNEASQKYRDYSTDNTLNTYSETKPGKLVLLWKKNKRNFAIAAAITGIIITINLAFFSSVQKEIKKNNGITPLIHKINEQDSKYKNLERQVIEINKTNSEENSNLHKAKIESKFRATGFLIDSKNNLLITNAHVLNEASNHLIIEDQRGRQYTAEALYVNKENDLAVVRVIDKDFQKYAYIPYNIGKSEIDLGDEIFTLGYPKQEIVYGEGYVSAKNGYELDSLFFQINAPANQGNSGSPIFNNNGELIGVISSKETNADGVVFAIKSKYIREAINEIKDNLKPNNPNHISAPSHSNLGNFNRKTQIKKIEDYIFMIKGD